MKEKPFLHLGDLDQLNGINSGRQYKIAKVEPVHGGWKEEQEKAQQNLLERLVEQKCDGACNVACLIKTIARHDYRHQITGLYTEYQYIGTPVTKKDK